MTGKLTAYGGSGVVENGAAGVAYIKAGLTTKKVSLILKTKCIITKTYLYNFDSLKPHFYTIGQGFTGVYIIFRISAQKHRLWVLVRTASARWF